MSKIAEEFKDYIITIGYSSQLGYELSNTIKYFLDFIKEQKGKTISKVTAIDVTEFINFYTESISERTHKKRGNIRINDYIYALRHFNKFLFNLYDKTLPISHIQYLKDDRKKRTPLLVSEIKSLFEATDNTQYGMRDRAMLVLYYSCGLRRNEGINVQTTDIDFKRRILFVREGKFGNQRYVPFTEQSKKYLEEYISIGRRRFIRKSPIKKRKTLFISKTGERLTSQSLFVRLKRLSHKAGIDKKVGLHILRHSIATHLMQKGMSIYDIATFLGHKSIESTQIYTHVTENDFS